MPLFRQRTARTTRLHLEQLEGRELPAVNPFSNPAFTQDLIHVLQQYPTGNDFGGIPQVSLALIENGQVYAGGATNPLFFKLNRRTAELRALGTSRPVGPSSLFRLASASKTFAAAAVLTLQQQLQTILGDPDYSLLDQSAFALLGYAPGQEISGFAPTNPGMMVKATVPAGLFSVTLRNLLQMQSGLNGNAVQVASQSFPSTPFDYPFYLAGSYAVLQFGGPPPPRRGYSAPPTVAQVLNYFVFQIGNQNGAPFNPVLFDLSRVGTGFDYQNINFDIAGQVVANLAQQFGLAADYPSYLQKYVLGPIGIQPPPAKGAPQGTALFGLAHPLQRNSFPTEVTYYTDPTDPTRSYSVLPDPRRHQPPFYPAAQVYEQYGGTNIHVGASGFVATPTALATFQRYLGQVIQAGPSAAPFGPLTYDSVAAMLAAPASDAGQTSYFGLGLEVELDQSDPTDLTEAQWGKGGNEPGTLSEMKRLHNGVVISMIFNLEPPEGEFSGLLGAVEDLMLRYALPGKLAAVGSTTLSATVNTRFTSPPTVMVTSAEGVPLAGIRVTFAVQSAGGAGGTFANGQASIVVLTNALGVAVAPFTANGQTGSYTLTANNLLIGTTVTFQMTNLAALRSGRHGVSSGGPFVLTDGDWAWWVVLPANLDSGTPNRDDGGR